jgi:hypothetical protein
MLSKFPFNLGIALDQTIECTINKYGRSHGEIDGRLEEKTIDQWVDSFAFRALGSTVMHEICHLETAQNSVNSHVECSSRRQELDHDDLTIITTNLHSEDLFNMKNSHCHKLCSSVIFHKDIIENICNIPLVNKFCTFEFVELYRQYKT